MSKQEELLGFYTQVLSSLNIEVEDDAKLVLAMPGVVDAKGAPVRLDAVVGGRAWVLPTREVLKASPWETQMAFHPLSENFVNADSATFNKLKSLVNVRLNMVLGQILVKMMEVAANPAQHKTLGAKASKFLKAVPEVKASTIKHLEAIIARSDLENATRRLVNVFVKRRAKLGAGVHLRGAMVNFPVRSELSGTDKVFGETLSKKDREAIAGLFDYLLPDNEDLDTYSVGADSHVAPSFVALMKAFAVLAGRFNEVIHDHRKIFVGCDDLVTDVSWAEALEDLKHWASAIPPLPGNVGDAVKKTSGEDTASEAANVKPVRVGQRATRLFDAKAAPKPLTDAPQRFPIPEAVATQGSAPSRTEAHTEAPVSFSDRVHHQQHSRPVSTFGQAQGFGQRGSEVPSWANDASGSRVVAGPDPRSRFQTQGIQRPASSFQNRVSHRLGQGPSQFSRNFQL